MRWWSRGFSDRTEADKHLMMAVVTAAAILFIATAIVLLDSGPRNDVVNFYHHAMSIKDGVLPYSGFEFEFPPLSLVFFTIPGLFTSDLVTYSRIFAFQSAVFMSIAAYCIMRMAPDGDSRARYLAGAVFTLLILLYLTESVKKFDAIVMSLTIISLFFFSRGRWGLAYGIMAMAALTKMYPACFLILMAMYNGLSSHGGTEALKKGILACIVMVLVAFVPLWVAGVGVADSLSFISFHAGRGFQVESTMATLIMILGKLGLTDVQIVPANDTNDVAGPIADALSPDWMMVCLVLVGIALIFCVTRMPRGGVGWSAQKLAMAMMFVCIVFMLSNKVFSTQYMMWLFPFIAMFCYMPGIPGDRLKRLLMLAVVMQLLCIVFLRSEIGSWIYILACASRDLILVVLAVEAARRMCAVDSDDTIAPDPHPRA